MIITALILMVTGIVFILRSSAISGRVLTADDVLRDGGFMRLVRHVFRARPFAGFQNDRRILYFGLSGLLILGCGAVLFVYSFMWIYNDAGSR
ncbi:MAG: hypothetical protein IPM69_07805 [Ignavibacteria bacterium]|nr:hypothetical protein [Ignavibacteria bacterium]